LHSLLDLEQLISDLQLKTMSVTCILISFVKHVEVVLFIDDPFLCEITKW